MMLIGTWREPVGAAAQSTATARRVSFVTLPEAGVTVSHGAPVTVTTKSNGVVPRCPPSESAEPKSS